MLTYSLTRTAPLCIALLGVLALPACDDDDDCVTASGTPVTQDFDIAEPFARVTTSTALDLRVRYGTEPAVSATASPNILPEIEARVSGGTLSLDLRDGCYRLEGTDAFATVTLPTLESIETTGSGDMDVSGLRDQASLQVQTTGSGDVTLTQLTDIAALEVVSRGSGSVSAADVDTLATLDVRLRGSGDARLFGAPAAGVTVESSGSGDAEVTAIDALDADLSGSGDVRYRGRPAITQVTNGSGDLVDGN